MDHGTLASSAQSKAAAWAWYQRGAGSTTSLRPEAATGTPAETPWHQPRRSTPSRFKLEAAQLMIIPSPAKYSPSSNISKRLASLQLDDSPGVSWDCGSVLFDSFELVAIATKLENAYQLNFAAMERISSSDMADIVEQSLHSIEGKHDHNKFLIFSSEGHEMYEKLQQKEDEGEETKCPVAVADKSSLKSLQPFTTPAPMKNGTESCADQRKSKQAIYDMFCRYETVGEKSLNKPSKKPKAIASPVVSSTRNRKRGFHSLSRAFPRQVSQFGGNSLSPSISSEPPQGVHEQPPSHLNHALSCPGEASGQLSYYNRTSSTASTHPFDSLNSHELENTLVMFNQTLKKQYSDDHLHHVHHHHYHHHHYPYLFRHHSDEGLYAVQPPILGTEKSHVVTAAGLRTQKAGSFKAKMEGALLDYKRKWKDMNTSAASG